MSLSMISSMIVPFIVCSFVTIGFAILFNAPVKELPFIGIAGGICWVSYLLLTEAAGCGIILSTLIATFFTTVYCRITAAVRNCPVTVYLLAGVFCLVPGGGIYHTSYYLISKQMTEFAEAGFNAVGMAAGIALGISLGFGIPQKVFSALHARLHG